MLMENNIIWKNFVYNEWMIDENVNRYRKKIIWKDTFLGLCSFLLFFWNETLFSVVSDLVGANLLMLSRIPNFFLGVLASVSNAMVNAVAAGEEWAEPVSLSSAVAAP